MASYLSYINECFMELLTYLILVKYMDFEVTGCGDESPPDYPFTKAWLSYNNYIIIPVSSQVRKEKHYTFLSRTECDSRNCLTKC